MNGYDFNGGMAALGIIGLLLFILLGLVTVVLSIVWMLVPFAVFAIRRRVDEQQAVLLRLEQRLAKLVERDQPPPPALPPTA
ncbi:MAG: hypothetical protein ACYCWW_18785 [Deltaproteobacteria bacterium]